MAGVLAENYQLKWHSHSNHLHSSVATLYRSDNFTDVTLVTCDGRYLSAHRFVLSACSSYLNRILQIGSLGTAFNPNMVIILPPEVSYRTLAILLQYMYSGEATVSNDQLSGVLRAGEILRIKGLCHNKEKRSQGESTSKRDPLSIDTYSGENLYINTSDVASTRTQDISSAGSSITSQRGSCKINNQQTLVQVPLNTTETEKTEESSNKKILLKSNKNKQQSTSNGNEVTSKVSTVENSKDSHSDITIEDNMKGELLVKEEPLDWDDIEEDTNMSNEGSVEPDVSVKSERGSDNNLYAPLTCDMCQETFTTPALWVRHIENHPATELPRKKRKKSQSGDDDEDEEEFPALRCELCQKIFTSPADWVRHIQSSHTEEQLALSNSAKHSKKSPKVSCASCNKTFPSIASMLIHSRTHTGEKPYVCCVCEKGFNVKSNLLRHLRTLHDHLMHPKKSQSSSTVKDS
ncbi:hypothetical protein O3M35_000010 [Rhynocoris fuscipes]|uniref:Uncharacterized protein n=1 Tax=Rhynocoris fuscipes TaxID=488301 RepID=A0AAW1DL68_9HEMI